MTDAIMLPIATILIVERRICRCGMSYESPGRFLHEMFVSPKDTTYERVIQHIPDTQRYAELSRRTTFIVEENVSSCQSCWRPNCEWEDISKVRPILPKAYKRYFTTLEIEKVKKAKKEYVPTLDELV